MQKRGLWHSAFVNGKGLRERGLRDRVNTVNRFKEKSKDPSPDAVFLYSSLPKRLASLLWQCLIRRQVDDHMFLSNWGWRLLLKCPKVATWQPWGSAFLAFYILLYEASKADINRFLNFFNFYEVFKELFVRLLMQHWASLISLSWKHSVHFLQQPDIDHA